MLKTVAITSGGGGGNGTVTQVGGTGTVNGITLTGNVTTTGNLTLGGTLGNIANSQLTNSAVTIGNTSVSLGSTITNIGNLTLANVTITSGTVPAANVTGLGTMATQNANAVVVTGGSINNTAIGNATANTGVFTTLTNTGTAYLGGASGNQSLQVNNVASAVNYAQIVGAVTTGAPTLSAQGTDTNINAVIAAKGTGSVQLQSSGAIVMNVGSTGTGVGDFINIYPTANNMNWVLAGTDTNIGYTLNTKGTGAFYFVTGGGQQVSITSTASAVNYLNLTGAATGAAPILSAGGSDANISLTLTTKGTGIVQTAATLKYAGVIAGLSTKTANYTLVATDHTVLGNATTASFSLTLPTSVGATGQVYIIKKVDSTANTVTILTTSSQTIDGSTSKVLSYQYDGFQLQSDGANWMIIGNIFGRNGTTGTF